ncbi:MAG: T9SS type A sorting domain-containing protein [Bacteroidota bacterium]
MQKSLFLCLMLPIFGHSLFAQIKFPSISPHADVAEELKAMEARYLANRPYEAAAGKHMMVQLDSTLEYDYDASSNVWEYNLRERFFYPNPEEQITMLDIWEADLNRWKNVRRGIYQYDPVARTETDIWSEWDDGAQELIDYGRWVYESDAQNRLIRIEIHDWVVDFWRARTQMIWEYEENSQDYLYFRQRVNPSTNTFKESQKDSVSFYPNGRYKSLYSYLWKQKAQGYGWGIDHRILYSQDSLGRNIEEKRENFNDQSLSWDNYSIYVNTYDSAGNRIERILRHWNAGSTQWIHTNRETYMYNTDGKESSYLKQWWDDTVGEWENDSRTFHTYHLNGKWEMRETNRWRDSMWTDRRKMEIDFNAYDEREQFRAFDYQSSSAQWIMEEKKDYFWSETIMSNSATVHEFRCEFPNPIRVDQAYHCSSLEAGKPYELQLYDLNGRLVQAARLLGHEPFQLSGDFSPGLYMLTILDDQQLVYRRKVIIE